MTSQTFLNPEIGFSNPTTLRFSFIQVEETLPDLSEAREFVKYVYPIDRKKQLKHELKTEKVFLDHFLKCTQNTHAPDGFDILNQCIPKISMFHSLLKVNGCVESIKRTLSNGQHTNRKIMVICSYSDAANMLKDQLKEAGISADIIYDKITKYIALKKIAQHESGKYKVLIVKPEGLHPDIKFPHVQEIQFLTTSHDVVDNTQAIMRCYSATNNEVLAVRIIELYRNPVDIRLHRLLMRHIVYFFTSISANITKRSTDVR